MSAEVDCVVLREVEDCAAAIWADALQADPAKRLTAFAVGRLYGTLTFLVEAARVRGHGDVALRAAFRRALDQAAG